MPSPATSSDLSGLSIHIATMVPGRDAARELAHKTDEAVRTLARAASSVLSDRWAIIALGGWGCGELLPLSDLDLLVLSDAPASRLKPFVEAVLYPLWDSGLKVGHQVRSPKEQQAAMRSDVATRTAALTGRAIAGDLEWAQSHLDAWAGDVGRRPKKTISALAERPRPGSPWLLEADLKQGAGGRRDYDEMTWIAGALSGKPTRSPASLADMGILEPAELDLLLEAAEVVSRARWILQRGGFGDLMSQDAEELLGDDAEQVQEALGNTALLLSRVRARVRRASAPGDGVWSPQRVLTALDKGPDGLEQLECAAQSGSLDDLIPGFRRLMSIRRPGLGHELTVGAHCLKTASLVGCSGQDPALTRSRQDVGDLAVVHVAALVHDTAKAEAGADHALRGAETARLTALSFGLADAEAQTVSELVRLHLVLVETALHADLNDENVILKCASEIRDSALIAPLHLLTAADSIATSPATWTEWTSSLVTSLVVRLDAALSPDIDGAGLADRGANVRQVLLATLDDSRTAERAFIAGAPLRYLAARNADDVLRDAALMAEVLDPSGDRTLRIIVGEGPVEGSAAITVAAADRPFLLASIAGAAALAGLDILSLDAYGSIRGVALDSLVVESSTGRALSPSVFAGFERLARSAMADRYDLSARLREQRRHYPSRTSGRTDVRVSDSAWDTTVRVRVPSRVGLLHDLASAVSSLGLDISWARVNTVNGMADDTFHLTGEDGGPVTDRGILGHLSMRLREAASPKRDEVGHTDGRKTGRRGRRS